MLLTRLDRVRATARLLPAAPIIGVVMVLSALGLAPNGDDQPTRAAMPTV